MGHPIVRAKLKDKITAMATTKALSCTGEVGGVGFVMDLVERDEDELAARVVFDEGFGGDLFEACR